MIYTASCWPLTKNFLTVIGFIIGDGLSPTRLAREPECIDYSSQSVWRGVLCSLD